MDRMRDSNRQIGKKNEKKTSKETRIGENGVKGLATWSGGKSPTELGALHPGG